MPSVKSKTPAKTPKPTVDFAASVPQMRIRPPIGYSAIPSSYLTLFCGHGMVESSPVLVPYIDMRLMEAADLEDAEGAEDDDTNAKEGWRATLAYENVAYVVMDLANDFRAVTRRLRQFSSGELHPEPERLKYAALCLETTRNLVQSSLEELQGLLAETAQTVAADNPTQARKPPAKLRAKRPT